MVQRTQRRHLMREPVPNPAILARRAVKHLHYQALGPAAHVARLVDHRESSTGHHAAQLVISAQSFARIIPARAQSARTARALMAEPAPQQEHAFLHSKS